MSNKNAGKKKAAKASVAKAPTASPRPKAAKAERVRVAADALPRETLQEAERVAAVIHENYAGVNAAWDEIAQGLELAPNNNRTKYLIWSASAYGLIQKNEDASYSLTETGRKLVAPTYDGEDLEGRRKAALTPSVLSTFFSQYAGKPVPDAQHFANVLETRFSIPRQRTSTAAELIIANGHHAQLLRSAGDKLIAEAPDAPAATGAADANLADTTGVVESSASEWQQICFYITPIGDDGSEVRKHADMMLNHLIKPAVESHGLRVVRADNIAKTGLITQQIFEHLAYARICAADLSFGSQNAFYELKAPAIQLIRKGDRIPFDVSQGRTIIVDTSDVYTVADRLASATRELMEYVRASLAGEGEQGNPVDVYFPGLKVTLPPPG